MDFPIKPAHELREGESLYTVEPGAVITGSGEAVRTRWDICAVTPFGDGSRTSDKVLVDTSDGKLFAFDPDEIVEYGDIDDGRRHRRLTARTKYADQLNDAVLAPLLEALGTLGVPCHIEHLGGGIRAVVIYEPPAGARWHHAWVTPGDETGSWLLGLYDEHEQAVGTDEESYFHVAGADVDSAANEIEQRLGYQAAPTGVATLPASLYVKVRKGLIAELVIEPSMSTPHLYEGDEAVVKIVDEEVWPMLLNLPPGIEWST